MDVKIDKSRREIISAQIDNLFCARIRPLANLRDFPVARYQLEVVANSIRKNETRVC